MVRCEYGRGQWRPQWEDAFRRFLRLDGAPAVRVRDFVARFGPLGIGDDGLPRFSDWVSATEQEKILGRETEPVEWYRHYARVLAATLRSNTQLNQVR